MFNVGAIYGEIKLGTAGYQKSVNTINKGQAAMNKGAAGTNSAFKNLWKQLAAGLGIGAGVAMAVRKITSEIGDVIKKGREFEREWANVTTMITDSTVNTEAMRHELMALSPTLGDTTDLAKGMYQVLSASIEPAKAIQFLGEAAKAAKAGVTDTKTAVDALTTVINAYGMQAEQVTDVSDIMFQTVKRGKLTYGELAHSLGTVVPVAATLGVDFKEVSAAISAMTRQGIQAQTATMQLRQVMMAILKPSEEAIKTAEKLGIEWNVSALKAKGLSQFLFEMKEKIGENTEVYGKLVPNVRALTGVMVLAGKASAGFAADLELMKNASGSTEDAFRKQMESMDFWLTALENTLNNMKKAFYEGLVTPIRETIKTQKELDEFNRQNVDSARELGQTIGQTLTPAFKLGRKALEMLNQKNQEMWGGMKGFWAWLKKGGIEGFNEYGESLRAQAADAILAAKGMKTLNATLSGHEFVIYGAFTALHNYVQLMIDSKIPVERQIEMMAAFRKRILESINPIKTFTTTLKLADTELEYASSIWTIWGAKIASTDEILKEAQKTLKSWSYDARGYIETAVPPARNLSDVLGNVAAEFDNVHRTSFEATEEIKIDWQKISDDIARFWLTGIAEMIAGTRSFGDLVKNTFATIGSGVGSAISGLVSNVLSSLGGMAGPIGSIVGSIAGSLVSMIGGLFGGKSEAEKEAEQRLKEQKSVEAQIEQITKDFAHLGTISESTAKKIQEMAQEMDYWKAVALNFPDIIRDVGVTQENVNALWEQATRILTRYTEGQLTATEAAGTLDEAFQQLLDGTKKLGQEGSKAMTEFIVATREAGLEIASVTEYVQNQLGRIPSALSTLLDRFIKRRREIQDAIDNLNKNILDAQNDLVKTTEKYEEELAELYGELEDAAQDYHEAIQEDIDDTKDKLSTLYEKLAEVEEGSEKWLSLKDAIAETEQKLADLNAELESGEVTSKRYKEIQEEITETEQEYREAIEAINNEIAGYNQGLSNWYLILQKFNNRSVDDIQRVAQVTWASFNSMIDSGMSYVEALDALADPLAQLVELYKDIPVEAGSAEDALMRLARTRTEHAELFEELKAIQTIMESLGNTGYLTADVFKDLTIDARQLYRQMRKAGMTEEETLRALGPLLREIIDNAELYGFKIDRNTQRIINHADAIGAIPEAQEDATEVMREEFDRLGDRFEQVIGKMAIVMYAGMTGNFDLAMQAMESMASDSAGNISNTFEGILEGVNLGEPTYPSGWQGGRGFVGGFQHGGVIEAGPYRPTGFVFGEGPQRERAVISHVGGIDGTMTGRNMEMHFHGPLVTTEKLSDSDLVEAAERIRQIIKEQEERYV